MKIILKMFSLIFSCVCVCACEFRCIWRSKEGVRNPKAGAIDVSQLPDTDAGTEPGSSV